MSDTNNGSTIDTGTTEQPYTKLGIGPEDAAAASVAQSMAFSAQNEVDAYRNQATVNMVAMGTAYAKWLQNPMMSDKYSEVVEQTTLPVVEQPLERGFGGKVESPANVKSKVKPVSLSNKVFNLYMSSPNSSE